jgi:phage N-6-adenine-methyltransferase
MSHTPENPRSCWSTPKEFRDWLATRWTFTLDAAADDHNKICDGFCDRKYDAFNLIGKLSGACIWINPPYCQGEKYSIMNWVKLGFDLHTDGNTVVMILPTDTSTKWFEFAATHGRVELLTPRINFDPPSGIKKSSQRGINCLVIFDGKRGINLRNWRVTPDTPT